MYINDNELNDISTDLSLSYIIATPSSSNIINSNNLVFELKYLHMDLNLLKDNFTFNNSHLEKDLAKIESLTNILTIYHDQNLHFRKYYIDILNHFEIFNLYNYKISTGTWYPNCSTDCLKSSVTVSLKKLRYTSNLTSIEHMINNIKEIYHIGELQELLIDEIKCIIQNYRDNTNKIDLNDEEDDPILKAFQEMCHDIIINIDKIAKYAIYNNKFIFNHSDNSDDSEPIKLIYNFNSISNNYSSQNVRNLC